VQSRTYGVWAAAAADVPQAQAVVLASSAVSRVTVEFVGPVRRPCPERKLALELDVLPTVGGLLERLGYSPEEAARLTVLVDGKRQEPAAPVPEGARVEILLPVGGG
jgi:sulfur carrier protein ThiS